MGSLRAPTVESTEGGHRLGVAVAEGANVGFGHVVVARRPEVVLRLLRSAPRSDAWDGVRDDGRTVDGRVTVGSRVHGDAPTDPPGRDTGRATAGDGTGVHSDPVTPSGTGTDGQGRGTLPDGVSKGWV